MTPEIQYLTSRLNEEEKLAKQTLARWAGKPNVTDRTVRRWRRVLREVEAKRSRLRRYADAVATAKQFPHGSFIMVRDALRLEVLADLGVYEESPADALDIASAVLGLE